MTPHPPHHIRVPRRAMHRSMVLLASLLVIGGTPLVARALDDTEIAPTVVAGLDSVAGLESPSAALLAPAQLAPAQPAPADRLTDSIDAPAVVSPEVPAERTVDPAVAVLTDAYGWEELGPRVAVLQQTLGVVVDGWYSRTTYEMHRAMLEALALPTDALPVPPEPTGPSLQQWAALRECESSGNYAITNASGKYRGAYQFDRPTWDSVAEASAPHLVGVDPAAASPAEQDAMALALYNDRGPGPWPLCGRHLR